MGAENNKHRFREHKFFERYTEVNGNIKKHIFTEPFCHYDVKFRSGNTNHYGISEIKCRNKPLSFFEFNPPYLELRKLEDLIHQQTLIKETNSVEVQPYYYHFTKDGFLQLFTLSAVTAYTYTQAYLPIDDVRPWVKVWKTVTTLTGATTIDLRR